MIIDKQELTKMFLFHLLWIGFHNGRASYIHEKESIHDALPFNGFAHTKLHRITKIK